MTPNTRTWRKSSHSENGGQCVEISSPTWRTSSYSNNGGQCVQVGTCLEGTPTPTILIRDTKSLPNAPTLTIPAPAFTAFLCSLCSL